MQNSTPLSPHKKHIKQRNKNKMCVCVLIDVTAEQFESMGIKDSGNPENEHNKTFYTTIEKGTATQVYAATAPELSGKGGAYLSKCSIQENYPHSAISNKDIQQKLWEMTEKLIAEKK